MSLDKPSPTVSLTLNVPSANICPSPHLSFVYPCTLKYSELYDGKNFGSDIVKMGISFFMSVASFNWNLPFINKIPILFTSVKVIEVAFTLKEYGTVLRVKLAFKLCYIKFVKKRDRIKMIQSLFEKFN